jgi:hypothetical protein
MRAQLGAILESTLTDEQWAQSTLAARDGGLDLVDWGTTSAVTGKAYKQTQQLANSEQHSVNDPQVKQPSVFQIIKTVQQHAADELEHGDSTHYTKALRNVYSDGDDRVRWHAIRPNEIGLRLTDQQWVTGARLLLGIPIVSGAPSCNYSNATDHALCCSAFLLLRDAIINKLGAIPLTTAGAEERESEFQQQHPATERRVEETPPPATEEMIVRTAARDMAKAAAPGPDGLTREIFLASCSAKSRPLWALLVCRWAAGVAESARRRCC